MIVRELYAKLGLEFDDTKLKKVEEKLDGLKGTLTTIGLSVTAASATLFGFAKFTANAGDEAGKTAMKLGMNVETLQRLQVAAEFANISNEALQQSLGVLAKQLVAARDGSADASKGLRKAGIDVRAMGGRIPTTTQALTAISDRFASMPDGLEKTALAMDLFGRSGKDMIPFLSKGSAELAKAASLADRYGLVLSETEVKMSAEFNDTVQESIFALRGLRNILGIGLIKVIKPLAEQFNAFISENRVRLAEKIRFVFDGMARFVQIVWKAMLALVESVGGFLDTFGGLQNVAMALGTIAAIFLGGKLLYGIGSVVMAIWSAVTAFTAMNLAALAIPIAIDAAVVAIGLLIDDVITFFQGGESYFGRLVSWFDGITSRLGGWGVAIKAILATILAPVRYLILGFRSLLTLIDMIRGKTGAKEGFGNILSNLGNTYTGGLQKGNEASLLDLLGFGGMSPTSSPTTGTSNIQAPVRVDSNMTFNVGPNVDPTTVAPKLQNSIDDGFQALIRKANSSYLGEGAPVY